MLARPHSWNSSWIIEMKNRSEKRLNMIFLFLDPNNYRLNHHRVMWWWSISQNSQINDLCYRAHDFLHSVFVLQHSPRSFLPGSLYFTNNLLSRTSFFNTPLLKLWMIDSFSSLRIWIHLIRHFGESSNARLISASRNQQYKWFMMLSL